VSNDLLSAFPNNVDEYVEFNVSLNRIDNDLVTLERRYTDVQEMWEIMREYGIKVDQDLRKAFGDLTAARNQLTVQVNNGKDRAESDVNHFSKALEEDIPELSARCEQQSRVLKEPLFGDSTKMGKEERQEVLAKLTELEENVKTAGADAERFNRYQDVLRMEVTPFEDIDELKQDFKLRADLWRGMETWEGLTESWNATQFTTVEVEDINKKVAEYNKIAVKSQKAMEGNEVPIIWGAAVLQFKNTLPVVVALRNKALKERHWAMITEMIGQELNLEAEDFTLGALLEMGVDKHMEAIQEVSGKATAELALEEMLEKVTSTWEEMELIVNPYKDSKDMVIVGSVEDITVALEDSLVTISTIAGSRFVGPIRD
jgi:dynein heavy chain